MEDFEVFWRRLLKELATRKTIKNWTKLKDYYGEDFTAFVAPNSRSGEVIKCSTSKETEMNANMEDFRMVYENWDGYLSGRITRADLLEKSFVTTYTISIIHQYLK